MYDKSSKPGRNARNGYPFICHKIPFVGINSQLILPNIGCYIPLIRNKGLTLVELVITLTIAGILVTVAAPSFQKFVSSNRLTSQINGLLADISLARNEAIKRNGSTGICVTAAGGASCVTSGNWANGWLVYYNDGGTKVSVKIHEALSGKNTLTSPGDEIVFTREGLLNSGAGQFTLTDPKTSAKRIVCLSATGRASLSDTDCPS